MRACNASRDSGTEALSCMKIQTQVDGEMPDLSNTTHIILFLFITKLLLPLR